MASLTENVSRIKNASEKVKISLTAHGIDLDENELIDSYVLKLEKLLNIKNETQFCYMFKNGRFLNQFDDLISQCNAQVLDCTGIFHNICLNDQTYRTYDFQNLDLSQCTNFYDAFTGGADWWTLRGDIINFDMSKVDNCNYTFNTCTYLDNLTFKEGASFGGNSDNSSLTLDLSQTNINIEGLGKLFESISINTKGNTRIIKIKSSVYDQITDDILLLSIDKDYTITI